MIVSSWQEHLGSQLTGEGWRQAFDLQPRVPGAERARLGFTSSMLSPSIVMEVWVSEVRDRWSAVAVNLWRLLPWVWSMVVGRLASWFTQFKLREGWSNHSILLPIDVTALKDHPMWGLETGLLDLESWEIPRPNHFKRLCIGWRWRLKSWRHHSDWWLSLKKSDFDFSLMYLRWSWAWFRWSGCVVGLRVYKSSKWASDSKTSQHIRAHQFMKLTWFQLGWR